MLWTKIHPKLIAHAWLVPNFRRRFRQEMDFRVGEAHRISQILVNQCPTLWEYQSNIDILITDPANLGMAMSNQVKRLDGLRGCVPSIPSQDTIYGETFFTITRHGFVMPWPDSPSPSTDPDNIFIAYLQGGGVLPDNDIVSVPSTYGTVRDAIMANLSSATTPTRSQGAIEVRGISGVALLALFAKWPRMVALAWHSSGDRAEIMNRPEAYIMPEVLTQLDPDLVQIGVDPGLEDFEISYAGMPSNSTAPPPPIIITAPLPEAPQDANKIYEQLIMGYATNPLYTNTF